MSAPKLTTVTVGTPKPVPLDEGLAIIKRGLDPLREVFRKQAEDAAEMAELAARGARGELSPAEEGGKS